MGLIMNATVLLPHVLMASSIMMVYTRMHANKQTHTHTHTITYTHTYIIDNKSMREKLSNNMNKIKT